MEPVQISSEQLEDLAKGIRVMELAVESENMSELWVLALTSSQEALWKAQEAIQESAEGDEDSPAPEAPKLNEIAIAFPVKGGDDLYYLVGSGMRLQKETFAYKVASEGARVLDFTWARTPAKLRLSDLKVIELSDSDIYLDEFLERNGTAVASPAPKAVTRSQEATNPQESTNPIDQYLAS